MERLSAWMDGVVSSAGTWNPYLVLAVALAIAVSLWMCIRFSGDGHAKRRKMAKKFEEYCRMYEAGQRESEDEGFRRHVRDRKNHEEFLRRGGERHIPRKP